MDISPVFTEAVGWTATAVFTTSFFFSDAAKLRLMQICGALLWLAYGVLIMSLPVIVANVLVFSAAFWTTIRYRERKPAV